MKRKALPAVFGALVAGGACAAVLAMAATPKTQAAPIRTGGYMRALHGSAALLAASVLLDSTMEHYRGSFENPGMFAPLLSSSLSLVTGTMGAFSASARILALRRASYGLTLAVGAAGMAFHLYNVFKRPGGFDWLNLFYGAPLGAPAALSVCGVTGLAAESVARTNPGHARLWGVPAGRGLAGLSAIALAGASAEAALFHFRGAFQNPFMWAPVSLPPVAAGLMAKTSLEPATKRHPFTRFWLSLTLALGFIGSGFHAYGVSRAMGGWRNWSQNLIDGPPLPVPPSFSAAALTGVAALSLIEEEAQL